jgi:hypothetical protein
MVRFLLMAVALAVTCAVPARASESSCGSSIRTWSERCVTRSGFDALDVKCPATALVFAIHRPTSVGGVEVRASAAGSFRDVAGLGVSPIGHFDDWLSQPESQRAAFEKFAACVADDPETLRAFLGAAHPIVREDPEGEVEPLVPWRPFGAALAAVFLGVLRLRAARAARRRRFVRFAGAASVLSLATFFVRELAVPNAFFHQNGQGPYWVRYALAVKKSSYGPGYHEIFSIPVRVLSWDPTRSVFVFQAMAAAFVPCFAWVVARRLGARTPIAAAVAVFVACDPLLARLAQSESYFATGLTLLFAAAALLCAGVPLERCSRRGAAILSTLGAGLLVSQAVRVHPLCWLGSAAVPLPLLLLRGGLRQRLLHVVRVVIGVALVVVVTTGREMQDALHAQMGAQFLSSYGEDSRFADIFRQTCGAFAFAAVFAAAAMLLSRRRRGVLAAVLFAVAFTVGDLGVSLTGSLTPSLRDAERALFLPVGVAALAVWLSTLPRSHRSRAAICAVVAGAYVVVSHGQATRALPTDALEANWVSSWKESLPPNAPIAFVEQVDRRIASLPLYGPLASKPAEPIGVPLREVDGTALDMDGSAFYVRSSLCFTPEGREACRAVERRVSLELVAARSLPARPSMTDLPYDSPTVELGLFRVHARRP